VAPGVTEIRVTFSRTMQDGSWSFTTAWKDSAPQSIGNPHFEADHLTCVLKVKLEPNKTYAYWLNSQEFHGFRNPQGLVAVPYILAFHTKSQ
jgi:RNA polymerase sigma-70 factor (ECF subfamily)